MMEFQLSCDGKTKSSKNQHNTIGFMPGPTEEGGTCPGATKGPGGCSACRLKKDGKMSKNHACYVTKLLKAYPSVKRVLMKNTELLFSLKSSDEVSQVVNATLSKWVEKQPVNQRIFRPCWAGDMPTEEIAVGWAKSIKKFPEVRFWTYTRSFTKFPVLEHFVGLPNCTLFLSVDPVNYEEGLKKAKEFQDAPNIAMAWMGNDAPKDVRWVKCPEITGKLKDPKDGTGACSRCRLCIDRYHNKPSNIQFEIH